MGYLPYQLVQDFFHQQYWAISLSNYRFPIYEFRMKKFNPFHELEIRQLEDFLYDCWLSFVWGKTTSKKYPIHWTSSAKQGVKWPFSKTRNWQISPHLNIFNQATSVNWKRHWSDQMSCDFHWAQMDVDQPNLGPDPTHDTTKAAVLAPPASAGPIALFLIVQIPELVAILVHQTAEKRSLQKKQSEYIGKNMGNTPYNPVQVQNEGHKSHVLEAIQKIWIENSKEKLVE